MKLSALRVKINEVYLPALQSQTRYLILKGGAGSGKSVFAAQKIVLRCLSEPGHRFLALRKVKSTLRSSVYQLLVDLVGQMDLAALVTVNKTEMRLTFTNGSEIIMGGMDDPEKIKSIAGITGIWCEEATEFSQADFNQLELRVRGETAYYKQFILSFNPIDEGHWLKARFYDNHDIEVMAIHSTYRDNTFLDVEYIHHLETRVKNDANLYRIYVQGEWGRPRTGGEFYKLFDFARDVAPAIRNEGLPLHISFDFNVNPGMHALVFQIDGNNINVIDEIKTISPHNTTKGICKEIERRYFNHVNGLFIYGDPAGKHQDTRTEYGSNDFTIIQNELARYRPQLRVGVKAPGLAIRGQFINSVLADNFDGLKITIDPKNLGFIEDLSNIKETPEGGKFKEKIKGDNGISFEKWGHYSDAFDYFICQAFTTSLDRYQKGDIKTPYIMGPLRTNGAGY